MKARDARRLAVGDFVVAAWSNSHRRSRIVRIEWPHFVIETVLESGEPRERRARYGSLYFEADYLRDYGACR